MGSLSIWHWLIVLIVGMLFFGGRGKISDLMGDVAKGINSFKKGLKEDETGPEAKPLDHKPVDPIAAVKVEDTSKAS